jgi:F420-non-reducing hydrogenase iron-sulfur subunit
VIREILELAGVNPERLALHWASAAEAPLYVRLITGFTAMIRELGALGEAEGLSSAELTANLLAARAATENVKVRTQLGKSSQAFRKTGIYSAEAMEGQLNEKLRATIASEMERQRQAAHRV